MLGKTATVTTSASGKVFPGQYYDQETGLHYNYFRYYDPNTGRYLTSDPIGLDGGLNTYLYAEANPVKIIDLFGLRGGCPANMRPGYANRCEFEPGANDRKECATAECVAYGAAVNPHLSLGDYLSRPNGSMWGIPRAQDNVCTLPFPIGTIANMCVLDRCQRHDSCYDENDCTASSWASSLLGGTKSCNQCNSGFFQ